METAQNPSESGVRLRTHTGLKVDVRIVAPDQFGNLLQHFTGSKQHNMALREAAVRKGLHVSEYGVLDDSTGETHRCAREEEVYELLGLEYIEPELRENRGELDAAAKGKLPALITVGDLRGDLHSHTTASDGTASIEEMALAARDAGYEYLAITDHSTSVAVRIDAAQLSEHVARIRELSGTDAVGGITLLAGSEVNVLPDGSLDYDDETLAELDWVVASVHSSFQMDSAAMTARIVRAISNPLVDVIGHLSGRKIERRPAVSLRPRADRRGGARDGDDAGDQLQPGPPRHERGQRPRSRGGGGPDRHQLRRPPGRRVRGGPLRGGDGAAGVAGARGGRQYAAVGRGGCAAAAGAACGLTV